MKKESRHPKKTRTGERSSLFPSVRVTRDMREQLIELWRDYTVLESWTPADRWLSQRIRSVRGSSLERRWIGAYFIATLRFGHFALAAGFSENGGSIREMVRSIPAESFLFFVEQRLMAEEMIPSPARFVHPEPQARKIARSLFENREQSLASELTAAGLPLWIQPYLQRRSDRSAWDKTTLRRFIRRHATVPPLWIRLNRDSVRTAVEREFEERGIRIISSDRRTLVVRGEPSIHSLKAYHSGAIDIQDGASQQIGDAVISRAGPNAQIWDCCAGNGGKTMQIAAGTESAMIRVSDINDRKLLRIHERAVQQNVTKRIAYVPWDGTALPEFHRTITDQGGFDLVLVDAPCSGSGTWRKNPDGRLFFEPSRLEELTAIQRSLLNMVAEAVRPGGWLIYGTCSLFVEENEDQVERFMAEHAGFALDSMKLCGNPEMDSDTTFVAAMRRMR